MKNRYRLFRRGRVFYTREVETGKNESLKTKERSVAERLLHAKNEAARQPQVNLAMARAYLAATDPLMGHRTWNEVMEEYRRTGKEATQERVERAFASVPFALIKDKKLIETNSSDFLRVLHAGGTSTNNYLRGIHNLALNLGWLAWPVLAKKAWPKIRYKVRRSITEKEHQRIIAAESNVERRHYYEVLWETGGAQSDIATLRAESIDWQHQVLSFKRQKLDDAFEPARIQIGSRLAAILAELPKHGALFPSISKLPAKFRSAEFRRRCQLLKISGVSLHSYRYAWAERAKACGYPERFAMIHLGHNSPAIHRAYAKRAQVVCPSLEEFKATATTCVAVLPPPPQSSGDAAA
jgi:hypothetical protein